MSEESALEHEFRRVLESPMGRRVVLDLACTALNDLLLVDRATVSVMASIAVHATPALIETGIPTTLRDGVTCITAISFLNYVMAAILHDSHPIGYVATGDGTIVAFGT